MTKLRLDLTHPHHQGLDDGALLEEVSRALRVPLKKVRSVRVTRKALDARRKLPVPTWRLTVDAEVDGAVRRPHPRAQVRKPDGPTVRLHSPKVGPDAPPVVVVGAGPAGLFAAWHLAEHGVSVTLVERGKPVETRARDFGRFRGRAQLDPESNLCFGEGGAGTYSDGKLTCRTKDPLKREVLERLVEVGAPERILIDAKPHIGTNLLFGVLKNLRARLIDFGVDVRFQTKVTGLCLDDKKIRGVDVSTGAPIDAGRVLLCTGHSARDTYEKLLAQGLPMIPKPFAVGVRAEHPQPLIDRAQYRLAEKRPSTLPPADYRLAHTTEAGRGVYSFCMCPGGMVVPTATEPDMVVVNGMSSARRSTPFANSGLVAQVGLEDLVEAGYGDHPLAGIAFQRDLERKTFAAGGGTYHAPAMRAADLVANKATGKVSDTHFRPGLVPYDLREILPAFITESLAEGLVKFDRTLSGYTSEDANLIAVESRTSSPLRIPRHPERMEVEGFSGLYAAGEGPGYAGGIMSAAIDGMRAAHAIIRSLTE